MLILAALILGLAPATFPPVAGVDGRLHNPMAEAEGKPVAFLFIAHDCPVCNTYAPEIGRLEREFQNRVAFDIVYCEPRVTPVMAAKHAREFSLSPATLLLDPSADLASFCKATVTPQAVVFDARGRKVYSGRIDDRYRSLGQQRLAPTTHDFANALSAVLANRIPEPAAGDPVGCFIVFPHPS